MPGFAGSGSFSFENTEDIGTPGVWSFYFNSNRFFGFMHKTEFVYVKSFKEMRTLEISNNTYPDFNLINDKPLISINAPASHAIVK
jgi:hypothetical protein